MDKSKAILRILLDISLVIGLITLFLIGVIYYPEEIPKIIFSLLLGGVIVFLGFLIYVAIEDRYKGYRNK